MNRSNNICEIITGSPSALFLLCLIGLTLCASPVAAQVFDSGPSDPALFDNVINVPTDPDILGNQSIGDDDLTTQLNVSDGGSIGFGFSALSGGEVNISGGSVDGLFKANSGSEVNISGGEVAAFFDANEGSEVNISGGSVGVGLSAGGDVNITGGFLNGLNAESGSVVNIGGGTLRNSFNSHFTVSADSEVNLSGINFVLDGRSLNNSLTVGEAFTIVVRDRDATLSGQLDDGRVFSFNLNPNPPVFEPDGDYFDPDATLTVTLSRRVILGDQGDGIVNFLDIEWFICELRKIPYRAEADINQDGSVDFLDIAPFIQILSGS